MNPLAAPLAGTSPESGRTRPHLSLIRIGDRLAGRFVVERLTEAGGGGTFYRAIDDERSEPVLVKVLPPASRDRVELVLRDVASLAALTHPAIAATLAFGKTPTGHAFVVGEWLEGEALARRFARGQLSVGQALSLARRVATGLAFAHGRGFVHGDLRPENLVAVHRRLDETKIVGFGLSRATEPLMTARGAVCSGAPGYMAPEQAAGAANIDARADVFALGCVLFSALTGKAPFDASDPGASIARVLFEEAPRARKLRPDVPREVEDLLVRMMARDPSDRPEDGDAVLRELHAVCDLYARSGDAEQGLSGDEQRLVSVVVVSGCVERSALDRARSAAAPFGAKVETLADGTVLAAIFGKGSARDQATQAARCALALADVLDGSLIALATGCGGLGASGIRGEVIGRAHRVLRGAPSGGRRFRGVAIDVVTASLLEAHFEIARDGSHVALRRERLGDRLETSRTIDGHKAPFVGRDGEMATLVGLLKSSSNGGGARAVLVSGPSGVGKSRLREEFVVDVRREAPAMEVWVARADPAQAATPFGMLAQVVRATAGVQAGDTLRARQAKLAARVGRHVSPEDAQRVTEFLGELGDIRFPEAKSVALQAARRNVGLMNEQLRRAWEEFLDAETTAQPVLVVLEDLHWADLSTVTLLGNALFALADRPLFVVATARPVVHTLFPTLWAGSTTEIGLARLPPEAIERMARAALTTDAAVAEVVAQIVEGAAGNPFYAEELVRAASAGAGRGVPEAILAMIQGHLETVTPEARRVLRAAAILGLRFGRARLARLVGLAAGAQDEMEGSLAELIERGLIVRRGGGADSYAFAHAAVQSAVYATLTDEDQRLGEELAAEVDRVVARAESSSHVDACSADAVL